jgi:hypothetical protein
MAERPEDCPDPSCSPLFVRQRLCWGRMVKARPDPNWQLYEGDKDDLLKNTHRTCLDGEEQYQVNAADCLYDAEGCIAVIQDVLARKLYNPCPDLAVPDPLGRLRRILGEEKL